MYQVLARKWRPKKFDEVIGQSHITKTLINAINSEKVAHAYLFTGTRGVGKTTIARLFAKAIRCEKLTNNNPCNECNSCLSINKSNSLDYIEIDGASNNGVDNIRELVENVQYLPSSGKYKVYVVDEVHMLSTGAFNALLKTLEEPPEHVVFIFATTDPHKLLGTVLSRCQRFDFKSVSINTLVSHLNKISEAEGIKFEKPELVEVLAYHGDGSVRDSLSLLDQVLSLSTGDVIQEEELYASLGLVNKKMISNIVESILTKDIDLFRKSIDLVKSENVSYETFLEQTLNLMFDVINNIDEQDLLNKKYNFNINFSFLTTAELMWIYESIIKDSNWALQSFDIPRSIEFILLKVIKREEILGIESDSKKKVKRQPLELKSIESKSIESMPEPVTSVPPEGVLDEDKVVRSELVEDKVHIEKNWDNFIDYCRSESKGIAVNLERAIFDGDLNPSNLKITFSEDSKIFADFVREPDHFNKLKQILSKFCEVPLEDVNVNISNIDDEKKKEDNLLSKVEKEQLAEEQDRESMETKLKENKFIKQAEDLFNTKITKIVLNDKRGNK